MIITDGMYKEIIYNDNIKNYVNESYACLSLIENNANFNQRYKLIINENNQYINQHRHVTLIRLKSIIKNVS